MFVCYASPLSPGGVEQLLHPLGGVWSFYHFPAEQLSSIKLLHPCSIYEPARASGLAQIICLLEVVSCGSGLCPLIHVSFSQELDPSLSWQGFGSLTCCSPSNHPSSERQHSRWTWMPPLRNLIEHYANIIHG